MQNLVRLPIQIPQVSTNRLTGQIIKIDGFGNAITNISESMLFAFLETSTYEIRIGSARLRQLNSAYAESEVGEPLAIIGSFGMLEIAVNGGSAAERLGLKRGDSVIIRRH